MIPLLRPELPPLQIAAAKMKESLATGRLTNHGPLFEESCRKLREATRRHCLPVSSGTAAVRLALQTSCPRGSRVAIPDFTHMGTLSAAVAAGMHPVLYPVSRVTWTLETEILKLDRKNLGAFVVVSPFGYHVDTEQYDALSKSMGIPVVYDFAGAWGMKTETKNPVCYSLHATKNIPVGEGGILSLCEEEKWTQAMRLANFDTQPNREYASPWGDNLKLDELRCALLLWQLANPMTAVRKADRKRELIDLYQAEFLDGTAGTRLHIRGAPSMCAIPNMAAERIEEMSQQYGFEAKRYYRLLTEMPGLSGVERAGQSSAFFRTVCALPSCASDEEAQQVVESVLKIRRKRS